MFSRFRRNKLVVVSSVIVFGYIILISFGPYIAPYGPNDQDLFNTLQSPSAKHIFGTDSLGRDVLSRIIYGTRYSLFIAIASVALATIIGVQAGLIAGFIGGRVDDLIMRLVDILLTFPTMITAIIVVSILGSGVKSLIVAISISFAPRLARLARSAALQVRQKEFITAARALGANNFRIIISHVLPNSLAPVLVEVTLRAGQAVLLTAALGFLGLGVRPPTPEWGTMISRGREYIAVAPHIVMATGLAISLSVLGFNLLGDGIRDVFDPKLKEGRR